MVLSCTYKIIFFISLAQKRKVRTMSASMNVDTVFWEGGKPNLCVIQCSGLNKDCFFFLENVCLDYYNCL